MYLKYLWLLTILFYLKHHHSPSPELLDTEGLLLGYCSAPLYFSIAVFTQDSWYYSTPLSEPKTFLKAGLQSFQHYPHLATKDSSAVPARFYSMGAKWLWTGTAQSGLCRGPDPAGSRPKNVSGRHQGDLRKHLQLQPQQAGCCSPDNNGLMRQAPAKPSPDNLCAASCPSSTQAPTHPPWPWDFQGRRATQNTKGSQIPRSRAGQAELLTY